MLFSAENMHHFVAEIRQQEVGSVKAFSKRAESLYDENLSAYVKIVLRRPFAKIMVRSVAVFRSYTRSTTSRTRTTLMGWSDC